MLNWALKYRNLGLSVIPLEPRGKRPLIKWEEFQKRRASEDEIKEWFLKWPLMNIGIVTGVISQIVVADLDGSEGLKSAEALGLTSSLISLTGRKEGGRHLWFKSHSSLSVANSVKSFPGLDIRGEGGYVVAPPSIHASGLRYRFVSPLLNVQALPLFPDALSARSVLTQTAKIKEDDWISKALEGMTNGNIDNTLFKICSRLRADGYSMGDALTLLSPHAQRAGAEDGHLEDKIENVWSRYEPNPRESGGNESKSGLVIHSPTNPDSLKQFNDLRMEQSDGESERSKLNTGYAKLDQMLKGGLKSSRLFTVAARTGVGKTNWLLGVSRCLCMDGKRVLLFSTEMPYAQIWERYIQTLEKPAEFAKHEFYVCDSFAPNLERVEEAINEIKPDLFIFDHINHVAEDPRELGTFMQGLNYLRRKYGCAGIISAQLNRSADWVDLKTGEKTMPRMSMIKGSGTIEQASSRVLLLSEVRVLPEGTEIVGNLDKNDNGPKGLINFMLTTSPYKMVEIQ